MILFHLSIACLLILQGYAKSIDKRIPIDQRIMEAAGGASNLDFVADKENKIVRVEMDILMKMEDYIRRQRIKMDERKGRQKRKAYLPESYRWTNKVVPYEIQRLVFTPKQRREIIKSIDQWNNYTCLNVRPAKLLERNKIRFVNGAGCSSYIGMIGGSQPVTLEPWCRTVDTIVHEIGHAIGFYHEQSRRDRDNYVEIVWSNIPSSIAYNFDMANEGRITNLGVPYDYKSVMHYSGRAGSSNGGITIRTLDPAYQDTIGYAPGLSFFDIRLANAMYNCNENCPTQLQCPGDGFQGQDCNCYCPSNNPQQPIRLCDETDEVTTLEPPSTTQTTTEIVNPPCEDKSRLCPSLSVACGLLTRLMNYYCPETCGSCTTISRERNPGLTCQDYGQHCDFLKAEGLCENEFDAYITSNCARTCGFCKPVSSELFNEVKKLYQKALEFLTRMVWRKTKNGST